MAVLCWSSREETPHVQGKRNPSKTVGVARGHQRADDEAMFLCILNAISILFADELFRWNLSFQIHNADNAEPSDWEIVGRYIGWTVLPMIALMLFITGLQ